MRTFLIIIVILLTPHSIEQKLNHIQEQNKETNCLLRVIAEGKQADENTCPSPDTDTSIDTQDGE